MTPAGRKRNAKIAANLERKADLYQYKANKARRNNRTDRYVREQNLSNKMRDVRKTAIKDLSEKDIERGRKYLVKSMALGMTVYGPIGVGVTAAIDESRTSRYVKEYDRTHDK